MRNFPLTMKSLFTAFLRIGFEASPDERSGGILLPVQADLKYPCRIVPDQDETVLSFVINADFHIEKDKLFDVACAVALVNGIANVGAWCVEPMSSSLYYRITMPINGVQWSDKTLKWTLEMATGYTNLHMERFRDIACNDGPLDQIFQ